MIEDVKKKLTSQEILALEAEIASQEKVIDSNAGLKLSETMEARKNKALLDDTRGGGINVVGDVMSAGGSALKRNNKGDVTAEAAGSALSAGVSGAATGASIGAAIGTPFFGVGAVVGGSVGALIGGVAGVIGGTAKGIDDAKTFQRKQERDNSMIARQKSVERLDATKTQYT